ncbi:TetR/AcrR family transcriptional regulator C-terminal domain-containing protein [Streptomyces sp. NPDC056486]|uniref:TetR/AcrR family transcriptional regulator C-terminal domain-containing protein n=1 Tax=Streptomyces sp. NPDC056486 TaxID=3345835 RepID=UPI0036B1B9EC
MPRRPRTGKMPCCPPTKSERGPRRPARTSIFGGPDAAAATMRPGDLRAGLSAIGRQYTDLIGRPAMAALFRIVIAELPRFPELGRAQFELGKLPYFISVQHMLLADWSPAPADVGHAVDDAVTTMLARYGLSANDPQQP